GLDRVHAQRRAGGARADRADVHQPGGPAHRAVRHREVRLMPEARAHFRSELQNLEEMALGALDMVISTLDRALEALEHQDVELASLVIADDDRIDGRYLEVHQGILSLLATQ